MQRLSRRSQRGASILAALVFVAILASVGLFVQSFSPQVNSRALTASGYAGSSGGMPTAASADATIAAQSSSQTPGSTQSTEPQQCTDVKKYAAANSKAGQAGTNWVLLDDGSNAAPLVSGSAPVANANQVDNKCYSAIYQAGTGSTPADPTKTTSYTCKGADAMIQSADVGATTISATYSPDPVNDPGKCKTTYCTGTSCAPAQLMTAAQVQESGSACQTALYPGGSNSSAVGGTGLCVGQPSAAAFPPAGIGGGAGGGAPGAQGLNNPIGGQATGNPTSQGTYGPCPQGQDLTATGCVAASGDINSTSQAGQYGPCPQGQNLTATGCVAASTDISGNPGGPGAGQYGPCPQGQNLTATGCTSSTFAGKTSAPSPLMNAGNTFGGGNPLSSLLAGMARGLGTPPPPPPPPPPQAPAQACSTDPNAYAQQQQQYQQQMQQYNYQLQQYQYQIQMQQYQQTYGTANTSPYGSPYATAYGSPYASPYSSPYGYTSPYSSPYGSAYGSPYATTYGSPYASPYSSPYGSPYSGGYGSSYGYPPQPPQQCTPSTQQQCQTQPQQPPASTCTGAAWQPVLSGNCITNWQCGTGVAPIAQLSCQPQIADVGMSVAFTYSCSSGIASSSAFAVSGPSGSATTVVTAPPQGMNTVTYSVGCISGAQVSSAICSVQVNQPSILMTANPQTVPQGATSVLGWITTGMSSCTVSSSDQSGFTAANAYNTSANGTALTLPMSGSATFDLHCTTAAGGTKDASVTVTSNASSSSATGNATSSVAVSTTADGSTVDHGGSMTITWNTTNQPSGAAVSLWLNDSTGKVVALIAGDQPLSGSYVWHVPAATSTCPTGGSENVCGADLSAGGKYQVEADVYAPSSAYVGDGAVPSNPTLPTYIDYAPAGLFTVGQ